MKTVKVKVNSFEIRKRMIANLRVAGYEVWTDTDGIDTYVCFKVNAEEVE